MPTRMLQVVTPHLRIESVLDLDLSRLRQMGLTALMLDVNCTLKNYSASELCPDVVEWLDRLRAAEIGLCLLSNGRGRRIRAGRSARTALRLHGPETASLSVSGRHARLGFERERTALVGDQIFADVVAGRLAGLTTILVRPIRPDEEPWFARLKRPLERVLLRRWDATGIAKW